MTDKVEQRDEAWLKTATAEQIVEARRAGELDDLSGETDRRAEEARKAAARPGFAGIGLNTGR
jgi:hypothetical protein